MNNRTIPQEARDILASEMMKTLHGLSTVPDTPLPILPDFTMSQQTFVFSIMSALASATVSYNGSGQNEPDLERMEAALGVFVEWIMQLHLAALGAEIAIASELVGSESVDRAERTALQHFTDTLADQGGPDQNLKFMDVNLVRASDDFCRAALFYVLQANPDLKGLLSSIQTVCLNEDNYDVFLQAIADARVAGKTDRDVFEFEGQKVTVGFADQMIQHYGSSKQE